MTGFSIKKTFIDIWDHLFVIMLMNIPFAIFIALFYLVSGYLDDNLVLSFLGLVSIVCLYSLYSLFVSIKAYRYSKYEIPNSSIKDEYKKRIPHALLHFVITALIIFLCMFGIPSYLSFNSVMTSFIAIMLIWVVLYLILMMQYYYPLSLYAPNDSPIMTLKRCNEFFLANIKWSFILLLKNIVSLAISIISGMIIPGLTGISVSRMVMTRLIIVFYEYLEANPNETKKSVNIEDALFKEKESVGNRSFWEMIFPWKSEQ